MNKNRQRQAKLNTKRRKQGEARKQQLIEQKQQASTRQRELDYQRERRSKERYLDTIAPRNERGVRQIFSPDPHLDIGFGMLLGAAGFFGAMVRVGETHQVGDQSNTIDHNPDEFKE